MTATKKPNRLPGVVLLLCLVGYVAYDQFTKTQDQNAATAAGFADVGDFKAASAAGISEPAAWAVERQRLAAAKQKKDEEEYERTRNPATKMSVKSMSWSKTGFGVVGVVTVTVENQNSFSVKDVKLGCDFTGNSGTKLHSASKTVYETLKPNSTRTFKQVNIGFIPEQAARGGCSVDSASRL